MNDTANHAPSQPLRDVVTSTLKSVQGTRHHLPLVTLDVLVEKLVEALAPLLAVERARALDEVTDALLAQGRDFSDLAEEEMRPSLEERAQEWYAAAAVARRSKRTPEVQGG